MTSGRAQLCLINTLSHLRSQDGSIPYYTATEEAGLGLLGTGILHLPAPISPFALKTEENRQNRPSRLQGTKAAFVNS